MKGIPRVAYAILEVTASADCLVTTPPQSLWARPALSIFLLALISASSL